MQDFQAVASIIIIVLAVIFLIFGIAVVFIIFRILSNIRRITQRVDETSENMSDMLVYVGKKIAPTALSTLGSILLKTAKNKVKRK